MEVNGSFDEGKEDIMRGKSLALKVAWIVLAAGLFMPGCIEQCVINGLLALGAAGVGLSGLGTPAAP